MIGEGKRVLAAAVATIILGATAHADQFASDRYGYARFAGIVSISDVQRMRIESDGTLLAVGRVDAVDADASEIVVLGQVFRVMATEGARALVRSINAGDGVALAGELTPDGYFVYSGIKLPGQYVPGASSVYISGRVTRVDPVIGEFDVQGLRVAGYAATSSLQRSFQVGDTIEIIGSQPLPGGIVLAQSIEAARASVGTGKVDASVGTGKADASVGTGKVDASVGTGKVRASVGTGKVDASVGTG